MPGQLSGPAPNPTPQGSRGSGKILFQGLSVSCRARNKYGQGEGWENMPVVKEDESQVAQVLKAEGALLEWLQDHIKIEAYQAVTS